MKNFIKDEEFDDLLFENMPQVVPDDVAEGVTPWRRATRFALAGVMLNLVTFSFMGMDYILPGIGLLFCLFGFRALRRENGWFRACFYLVVYRSAYYIFVVIVNANMYQSSIIQFPAMRAAAFLNQPLLFMLCIFLYMGFQTVLKKSGLSRKMGAAAALPFWYIFLFLLALFHYKGYILLFLLLVVYLLIFWSFFRLAKLLGAAGYAIRPAKVRVPDTVVALGLILILAGGIFFNWIFLNRYPMKWEKVQEELTGENERWKIKEIKEELIAKGFPEEVLNDLTEEEIEECRGALQVYSVSGKFVVKSVGEKYQYEGTPGEVVYYDKPIFYITQIAVELPGEQGCWKIIHYFQWGADPGFYGTESIQLWPTWHHTKGWEQAGEITGRVLYDKSSETYAAPYFYLGEKSYVLDFPGNPYEKEIFATFSAPKNAHNCRAYLAYTTKGPQEEDFYISSWVFYTHQSSYFQYPAVSVMEHLMSAEKNSHRVFETVHTALQVDKKWLDKQQKK